MKVGRIVLLCITSFINSVVCMESPTINTMSALESMETFQHDQFTSFIDNCKDTPIDTLVERNRIELEDLKKSIKQKKKDALNTLKKKYEIPEKHWQNYCEEKRIAVKAHKEYMTHGLHNSPRSHDDESELIRFVRNQARTYNIPDGSICISSSIDTEGPDMMVSAKSSHSTIVFTDGVTAIDTKNISPAQLVIYPLLSQKEPQEQKVICTSMLEYVLGCVTLKQEFLLKFFSHYGDSSDIQTRDMQAWQNFEEAQSMNMLVNFCFRHKDQIELLQKISKERQISAELFRVLCVTKRLILEKCHTNSLQTFQ